MGPSSVVSALALRVNQVAASTLSVLVLGETGAGKELVAQAVHAASRRAARPFVAVDCGAIPETLIESELFGHEEGAFTGAQRKQKGRFHYAEGGTLFLDEIGNLSAASQAKLLRVLQERKWRPLGAAQPIDLDVRVIAATNEDLDKRVKSGEFRQDLFYRLAEYTIRITPLRGRRDDIVHLASRFAAEAASELGVTALGFDEDALERLRSHPWRGNVRELRNVVRQAVLGVTGATIPRARLDSLLPASPERLSLPPPSRRRPFVAVRPLKRVVAEAIEAAERRALEAALAATADNRTEAARLLEVDAKTLYRKLKRYGLGA